MKKYNIEDPVQVEACAAKIISCLEEKVTNMAIDDADRRELSIASLPPAEQDAAFVRYQDVEKIRLMFLSRQERSGKDELRRDILILKSYEPSRVIMLLHKLQKKYPNVIGLNEIKLGRPRQAPAAAVDGDELARIEALLALPYNPRVGFDASQTHTIPAQADNSPRGDEGAQMHTIPARAAR